MTDQLERVRSLLKKVTYKPGWEITADWDGYPYGRIDPFTILLKVACPQPDTVTGEMTTIHHQMAASVFTIEHMKDGDILSYLVARSIHQMEMHEMDEWFKFDGIHVKDPHP